LGGSDSSSCAISAGCSVLIMRSAARTAPTESAVRSAARPPGRGGRFGELGAQPFEVAQRLALRGIGREAALGDLARVKRAEHVVRWGHSSW
jgi:hypothetical protein